jgi:hypothetical protein
MRSEEDPEEEDVEHADAPSAAAPAAAPTKPRRVSRDGGIRPGLPA